MANEPFRRTHLTAWRGELFGIAELWIVLFHLAEYLGKHVSSFTFRLLRLGNTGVDMFLFLSAIGLYHSLRKNSVGTFYRHRLRRVLLTFAVVCGPFILYKELPSGSFWNILLRLSTLDYYVPSMSGSMWYVSFIMVLYAFYPLLDRLDRKTKHVSTVALAALSAGIEYLLLRCSPALYDHFEIALSRVPIFLLGVLAAPALSKDKELPAWFAPAALLVGAACGVLAVKAHLPWPIIRYLNGIMGVCVVIVYSWIRHRGLLQFLGRPLKWVGSISLELYIVHVLAKRLIEAADGWGFMPWWAWYLLFPAASIAVSWILHLIVNPQKVIRFFRKKERLSA